MPSAPKPPCRWRRAPRSRPASRLGNTLLVGAGASLIYVRSRRSIVTLGAAGVAWVVVFGALTVAAFAIGGAAVAGFAFAAGAAGGAGGVIWGPGPLFHWPPRPLPPFPHPPLVIQGRHEMGAPWGRMWAVPLSPAHPCASPP